MDGWEVCKKIKSSENTKNITVVMLTVKSKEKSKYEVMANGYLHEPVDRKMLLDAVQKFKK